MKTGVMDEILLLQMRKLGPKEVKQLVQCPTARTNRDGIRTEYCASSLSFSSMLDSPVAFSRFFKS